MSNYTLIIKNMRNPFDNTKYELTNTVSFELENIVQLSLFKDNNIILSKIYGIFEKYNCLFLYNFILKHKSNYYLYGDYEFRYRLVYISSYKDLQSLNSYFLFSKENKLILCNEFLNKQYESSKLYKYNEKELYKNLNLTESGGNKWHIENVFLNKLSEEYEIYKNKIYNELIMLFSNNKTSLYYYSNNSYYTEFTDLFYFLNSFKSDINTNYYNFVHGRWYSEEFRKEVKDIFPYFELLLENSKKYNINLEVLQKEFEKHREKEYQYKEGDEKEVVNYKLNLFIKNKKRQKVYSIFLLLYIISNYRCDIIDVDFIDKYNYETLYGISINQIIEIFEVYILLNEKD